jgi:hypothetical protein
MKVERGRVNFKTEVSAVFSSIRIKYSKGKKQILVKIF